MNFKSVVFCGALVVLSKIASADSYQPSPSCPKPYKPYKFTSQWELDNFNDDVERYKRCIKEFVTEQQQAIETHRNASNEAIDEWNRFVRHELN